jgi:hypothetical protein
VAAVQETSRFDVALLERGPRGAGRVIAVYAHAAVIEAAEGALMTLVHPERPFVPFGVAVDAAALGLRAGAAVALAGRRLEAGGVTVELVGEGISLALPEAAPPDPRVVAAQLAALALPERTRALLEGRGDVVVARAHVALHALVDALGTDAPLTPRIAALTGLGPGATPTGDDLLVGVAAAAWRLAFPRRADYCAGLAAMPPAATTPVARAMLAHAARGSFLEPLRDFAAALGAPGAQVAEAAARLAAVGAQSGADLLAGVIAGTRAWISSP